MVPIGLIIGLIIALAVIGCSGWYWETRTTESFIFATFAWAAFALLLVKTMFVLVFVGLIAEIIYIYMQKPEVVSQAKDAVDEVICKIEDDD